MLNLNRDQKVDAAFGGLALASTLVTVVYPPAGLVLLTARLAGIAATNLIGAEVTKGALNWLNKKVEGPVTQPTA